MIVDDGFSVLDTSFNLIQDKKTVGEIKVVKLPIESIVPNPYQPRKVFDDNALEELSESIGQYGVLQPLLVAPEEEGKYMLIAGERRLRASKIAALQEVPVIISEYTSQQIAEIALIENLQREDLHFLEEAEGYEKLMNEFHLTQEAMAGRVGKKQSTIANKLRLLKLSEGVRQELTKKGLTERHARALLKLDEGQREAALKYIVDKGLNVRQCDEYISKLNESKQENKRKRLLVVSDVRIYLNSIKKIVDAIKDAGIPVAMDQTLEGDDVVVRLQIKNQKKKK
ncbi:MAG: ParB/RepB/Spo0J family partition protein [Acidaminococcaceae bacterium]|nr:ParB/RepB/Spo0J family partition protein [Acidaminococcaceae bacterium]